MHQPEPGPVADALASLDAALKDAREVASPFRTPAELLDFQIGLQSARSQLDALMCSVAAEAERANVQTLAQQRTVATATAHATGSDPAVINRDRTLGRWLEDYPHIADAFQRGVITRQHAETLRRLDNPRTRTALHESQESLVEAAATCGWNEFKHVTRYWTLAADPDGTEPAAQQQKRRGTIRTLADGTVQQINHFDALTGAQVKNAVERRASQMRLHDLNAQCDDTDAAVRTHQQCMVDAAAELQLAGHNANAGSGAPPLIHVVMSEQVAEDALTRTTDPDGVTRGDHPGVDPDRLPLDATNIDQRCELADGTPIHPRTVLALFATATFRRLVLSPDSDIIDLGRTARGFPRRLKQALIARARGSCEHPGCDAPVTWLQADHIHPWSKGGATSTTNGQILCDPHNKTKRDRIE